MKTQITIETAVVNNNEVKQSINLIMNMMDLAVKQEIRSLNNQYFDLTSVFVRAVVSNNKDIDLVALDNEIARVKDKIRSLTGWE